MVYCRMDGKETDSQRDEEHEAEIVDVDFGSVYFFGYAVIRNILVYQFGYDYLGDLIHYTNLIKYLSQIKSAIFFVTEKDGTF